MKRKVLTTAILLCSFIVCLAAIVDLDGKWSGVLKLSDGSEYPVHYNFKTEGKKLTGAIVSEQGELPLLDGKLTGNDFSFRLDVSGMSIINTGKYYGDSTILESDFNGQRSRTKLIRDK